MTRLRVLLVDDHPVVRSGLQSLIEAQPDMQVVGQATNGATAIEEAIALQPDVIVMDISMPVLGGAEATARIKQDCPRSLVVVLTAHEDSGYLKRLLTAGAVGYVLKRSAADDLVRAIRGAAAGETYLDPAVAGKVVAEVTATRALATAELSDRETAVLRLVAQGFLIKQIATRLGIEGRTVETYKIRAMEKLSLKTRVDVVRFAGQRGWLNGE